MSRSTSSSSDSSDTIPDETMNEPPPRSYQSEIMEQAKSENLIVCLPTGSGKTKIAIMLIKELSSVLRQSINDGGKRSIMLVPTNELAEQHSKSFRKHLDLKVNVYSGSSQTNIKLNDTKKWDRELETNQVLIFTAQKFLDILAHKIFSLDKANLLIFDECHHASGDHPYASIMKYYYMSCSQCPRILGLTASLGVGKFDPNQLRKIAKDLENIYHARIETGSDRTEIDENSTLVKVEHKICQNYEQYIIKNRKVTIIEMFKSIKSHSDELKNYLKTNEYPIIYENNLSQKNEQPKMDQIECRTLGQLKRYLENMRYAGFDLGLYGFSEGIKELKRYFDSNNALIKIADPIARKLYEKIINNLDLLVNKQLQNLPQDRDILYSSKVIELEKRIKNNKDGRSIVFVERVQTAAFLCKVLKELCDRSIRIEYVAASKAKFDGIKSSRQSQRSIVDDFRANKIKVLISTAVIEEGLDIPECNLVIRFNKPNNFSSYMQSKGRARARSNNATFVLLQDASNLEEFSRNKEEYQNYEYMEKMLKRDFDWINNSDSSSSDKVTDSLRPYRTENGIKISPIRAVQLIHQYCANLRKGDILTPRFCFYKIPLNTFKCVLSMPINGPIKEDITCENNNKRLAKQECCLRMIEKLHKIHELDDRCLPIRLEQDVASEDEATQPASCEIIDKQSSYFFHNQSSNWHLYRVSISNNHELGFIIPNAELKLPRFNLYGANEIMIVEINYIKPINLHECLNALESFCRYIFEDVFNDMTTGVESILQFDLEQSTFKLLPCLLTNFDEIDYRRMADICKRKDQICDNLSQLNDNELYCISYESKNEIYMNISDISIAKKTGDPWTHKKLKETVETYADHFECRVANIRIQRDHPMATMQNYREPRINYLNDTPSKKEKKSDNLATTTPPRYFPIEVIRYARLNKTDFELIFKLPSILVRIGQLYYIEQLRELLAVNIKSYPLLESKNMPIVTFRDCLTNIFSSKKGNVLPLSSLHYDLLEYNCKCQPFSDIIFQSITRQSANEQCDMENLEILGDCFLKLSMSMSLYHKFPLDIVGKLTNKKDRQISNKNLHQLAKNKTLLNYLHADQFTCKGKQANWIPPGYKVNDENQYRYTKQKAKRKAFADMMEALIGAFVISTDYSTTIKFMQWLGLDVIPMDEKKQVIKSTSILSPGLSDTADDVKIKVYELFMNHGFYEVEHKINYVFKNKAYLISAFTHPSYCNNRLTQCYERLEYLGDAVIDFLVVRCIFVEYYEHVEPGRVTEIRQDLANNGRLAYLLVTCDLHKKILHVSSDLFDRLTFYLDGSKAFLDDQPMEEKLNRDIDQWADPTAPKAIADVFEALIGAIFIDSGYSLQTVWEVIEPLLRPYIERTVQHRNLNPIRAFHENNGKVYFGEMKDEDKDFTCIAELEDGRKFYGYGKNKKIAKFIACQKAMINI